MRRRSSSSDYVVCVSHKGTEHPWLFDESGEDYLFPQELFAAIDLPKTVERKLALAT